MMDNQDLRCAEFGRELSQITAIDERLLQDALSVLEEQGLYAFFLYLDARGKEPGKQMKIKCHDFLRKNAALKSRLAAATSDVFAVVNKLGQSIDDLLFARDLIMQSLVYARYHVKAMEGTGRRT